MKLFEMPEIEIVKFDALDVITSSNDCPEDLSCASYVCPVNLGIG